MTARVMVLPVLECRACGRCYVPAPLVETACDACQAARARARQDAAERKRQGWRDWNGRRLDAVTTEAEGDGEPTGNAT